MQTQRSNGWLLWSAAVIAAISQLSTASTLPPEVIAAGKVVSQQTFDADPPAIQDGKILAPQSQPANLASPARKPSPALQVDSKGQTTSFPATFTVPADDPVYIVFDVVAAKPGRLVIHLQPAELPADLKDKVQKEDWADPRRHYDMRALVELQPGPWKTHAIDLNRRMFEAITRDKDLRDLAGMKIKAVGFEVNQPGEPDQFVLVDNVRVIALDGMARRAWLQAQMDQLRGVLEVMPASSPVAQYWRGPVSELNMEAIGFDPGTPLAEWRALSNRIETLVLASHNWQWPASPKKPYAVGTETSLRRVSGRHPLHAFRGRLGEEVSLESAGNEYEGFQVVLMPLAGPLEKVTIQVTDLVSADGKSTIPAKNFALCRQIEQYIQPSLRTTDEQVGWTPDALLPVTGPLDLKDSETLPLWVTLYVPASTPAGQYAARLTIKPANTAAHVVGVQLKVYGFSIPKVGRFRTQGHFALPTVQEWYGDAYTPEVRKAFYRLMVEHRFSPTSQYSRVLSPVEEDIPWVMRDGGNVIVIGGYHNKPLEPEKIDGWYNWLVENKYIDKALIYVGDETDDYKGIRAKSDTIRRHWPKLRIMVGGSKPRPELTGWVDVWDPITSGGSIYDFDAKGAKDAQARGEEVFWYTCIGPRQPYANCCNDDPLAATRALWWQAWKYGITGFEYWGMNQWGLNMPLAKADKPWPLGQTDDWNPRSYAWCNGDGLMVYPGPNGQPLSCNRFSVMRDAIEDWEVLFQLERAAELAEQGQPTPAMQLLARRARALLAVPGEITTDLTHWSDDPQVYLRHRQTACDLLETLRTRLGVKAVEEHTARWIEQHDHWLQEKFDARVKRSLAASPKD